MPVAICWYAYIAILAGIADAGRQSRRVRAQTAGQTLVVGPITSGVPVETAAAANDAHCRMVAGAERNFGGSYLLERSLRPLTKPATAKIA